ncbi:MAG TPA: hypothetical protein ENN58_03675 [bacterium]|nr:hypothetical protein [bacterium]
MRRIISLLFLIAVTGMLVSCDADNTGNFKIKLRLPIDDGECKYENTLADDTYCINRTDQILLSIYSTPDLNEPYAYTDRRLFRVTNSRGGKEEFIRSLKAGYYYRFFVEVTNENEKLKLTGGIDGIYYDDSNNYEVNIFLGAAGDFVRVVKERARYDATSIKSYFDTSGSSGAGAVALKNGDIYMAGGFSYDYDQYMDNAMIFDMRNLISKNVAKLRTGMRDHAVALLDDGSETGKVVIAFGENDINSYSNEVFIYDPKSNNYRNIGYKESLTMAKAITIDGEVYIVGGCSTTQPSAKVYKVSRTHDLLEYATMKQGRCNHSIANVSTFDEEGNINVRILVLGGSTDAKGEKTINNNENFAEIVSNNISTPVTISDRDSEDTAELLSRGLVSAAATKLSWDDPAYGPETAVLALGGYIQDGEGDNIGQIVNPNLFIFTETGSGNWIYDVNGAPNRCARPSMTNVAAAEKSVSQYAAVNCGAGTINRTTSQDQIIFIVQVRKAFDNELERTIMSASVKDSLMEGNVDPQSGNVIVDGPATTSSLGQAFLLGTEFVYQVSGYSLPID